MDRVHSSLPLAASRQRRLRSEASLLAVWMKTRSPHTIGLELPSPGMATFQSTPFLALNLIGIFESLATPAPLGPRKRSQLSARTGPESHASKIPAVIIRRT